MRPTTDNIYHFYNQGNNRRQLFYDDDDYKKFINLFKKHISPLVDLFAYCLMPNHFHFLLQPNAAGTEEKDLGSIKSTRLTNGFRLLQSQYANHLNHRKASSGSVFRQKIKSRIIENGSDGYGYICFHYIHQNPLKAGLVKHMSDWAYSSYPDYAGLRNDSLCNLKLTATLLNIDMTNFESEALMEIPIEKLEKIRPDRA